MKVIVNEWMDDKHETIRTALFVALALFLLISLILGVLGIVNIFDTGEITPLDESHEFSSSVIGPNGLDKAITFFSILLMLSIAAIVALYIAYRVTGDAAAGPAARVAPAGEGTVAPGGAVTGNGNCSSCGAWNPPDASFCASCGVRLLARGGDD